MGSCKDSPRVMDEDGVRRLNHTLGSVLEAMQDVKEENDRLYRANVDLTSDVTCLSARLHPSCGKEVEKEVVVEHHNLAASDGETTEMRSMRSSPAALFRRGLTPRLDFRDVETAGSQSIRCSPFQTPRSPGWTPRQDDKELSVHLAHAPRMPNAAANRPWEEEEESPSSIATPVMGG